MCLADNNSGDQYSYEVEQERKAVYQNVHGPMKRWYQRADLEAEFGRFPMFWQDLEGWSNYRTVYRRYMAHMDAADSGKKPSSSAAGSSGATTSTSAAPASSSTATTSDSAPRKRRKSRWGEPTPADPSNDDAQGAAKRRRSRWGSTPVNPSTWFAACARGAGAGPVALTWNPRCSGEHVCEHGEGAAARGLGDPPEDRGSERKVSTTARGCLLAACAQCSAHPHACQPGSRTLIAR